jgi:hypothetical protein
MSYRGQLIDKYRYIQMKLICLIGKNDDDQKTISNAIRYYDRKIKVLITRKFFQDPKTGYMHYPKYLNYIVKN